VSRRGRRGVTRAGSLGGAWWPAARAPPSRILQAPFAPPSVVYASVYLCVVDVSAAPPPAPARQAAAKHAAAAQRARGRRG
jgi:hypothetical protein